MKGNSPTQVRLRRTGLRHPRVDAFAFADDLHEVTYDWHSHSYHQLLYSFSGLIKFEAGTNFWLLPPQRAAWIPAGVRHRTILHRVTSGSIYFNPARYSFSSIDQISIFTTTPLLREMVALSMRWPNQPRNQNPLAESVFQALALYCAELARSKLPYILPRGSSTGIRRAIEFTIMHLEKVSADEVARATGFSVRNLRRHFAIETGLSWREFLTRARLLRAMELLSGGATNVTETAYECGFTNLSAFSKSFSIFAGQTPAMFRKSWRKIP